MTEEDLIRLKPNAEQRETIDYFKHLLDLENVHGADQKTIYWVLAWGRQVSLLFQIDKVLRFKGLQSQEYAVFKSEKYQKVAQNAKKRVPRNGFEVPQRPEKPDF